MKIIGAGLSGLIAANILRNDAEQIWESAPSLPNNHNAILRFRSDIVSTATNIPFKKVEVLKAVQAYRNPLAEMIAYSRKVTGTAQSRSIISSGDGLVTRFIAPEDFIAHLGARVIDRIEFSKEVKGSDLLSGGPYISTIPMPVLMKMMEYPLYNPDDFKFREGFVVRGQLKGFNAFGTVYIPHPSTPIYRVSVTGNELYGEGIGKLGTHPKRELLEQCLVAIGLGRDTSVKTIQNKEFKTQSYAKINPVPEKTRKDFILWASERGVYSLGRFATWRPGLLLDDLVNDVHVIRRLADGDSTHNYKMKKDAK